MTLTLPLAAFLVLSLLVGVSPLVFSALNAARYPPE